MAAKKTADSSLDVLEQLVELLSAKQAPQHVAGKPNQFDGLTELQKKQAIYQQKLSIDTDNYTRVEIPRMYQKFLGPNLEVGINGSTIKIPIDGRRHVIHKDFYPAIKDKLRYIDEKESRANNYDSRTGQTGDIFEYQPR